MAKNIPYYLRISIDEIVNNAREHITIHYTKKLTAKKGGMGCQIIDQNDYSEYFYEPNKYDVYEAHVIDYADQMSTHQNGIIALKKWEEKLRDFLEKPGRKEEKEDTLKSQKKSHTGVGDMETIQLPNLIQVVASTQTIKHAQTHVTRTPLHSHR